MQQLIVILLTSLPFTAILVFCSSYDISDDAIPISSDLVEFNDDHLLGINGSVLSRSKRNFGGCWPGCYSSCQNSYQCQRYSPRLVCFRSCCCPQPLPFPIPLPIDISTVCDGGPAVAVCINGLCGQGFFCNYRGFCCRCQSGNSSGPCVNGLCPAGYTCNTNDYCCPIGTGSVLGPCVNGQCPTGFVCGAGNLCYASQIGKK